MVTTTLVAALLSPALTLVGVGPTSADEALLGWEIELEGDEVDDIASAPGGGVYVAGEIDGAAGVTYFDAEGSVVWQRAVDASACCVAVAPGPSGPLVGVSADPATVAGISSDGTIEWAASGVDVTTISAIGSSVTGELYVAGNYADPDDPEPFFPARINILTKFDVEGAEEWSVELDDGSGVRFIVSAVEVLADGRVVVAASRSPMLGLPDGGQLLVFDETGEQLAIVDSIWDDLDPFVRSSLSIGLGTVGAVAAHPDGGFVISAAQFDDIAIARFGPDLERRWLRTPSDAFEGSLSDIVVAPSGDIITVGQLADDGAPADVVLRAFTSTGSRLWTAPVEADVNPRSIRIALADEDLVTVSYQRYETPTITGSTVRRFDTSELRQPELCDGIANHPFTDVGISDRVASDSGCLFALGVTTGVSPTTYGPDASVTREQMGAFMARLVRLVVGVECDRTTRPGGAIGPDVPLRFTDVAEGSFAYEDIGCIANFAITTGTSETTYGPSDRVTREQMGAFLARLYRLLTGDECSEHPMPFGDVSATSFARDEIACIFALGLTTGTSPTTYSPDDFVTRGQMASFLARLYRLLL